MFESSGENSNDDNNNDFDNLQIQPSPPASSSSNSEPPVQVARQQAPVNHFLCHVLYRDFCSVFVVVTKANKCHGGTKVGEGLLCPKMLRFIGLTIILEI